MPGVTDQYLSPEPVGRPGRQAGEPVLSVEDLRVHFSSDDGLVKAVDGVTYDVYENEVLGIVGESGSGKSVSSMAILGLLPKTATITGKIRFEAARCSGYPRVKRGGCAARTSPWCSRTPWPHSTRCSRSGTRSPKPSRSTGPS